MELEQLLGIAYTRRLDDAELTKLNNGATGLTRLLGLQFTDVGPDRVEGHVVVSEGHLQPFGLVNGGVYASIGETLGSVAGAVAAGCAVVGIENSTHFFRPASAGVIVGVATPVHVGRSTQTWDIVMTHTDKLLARTTLKTMVMRG